MSSPVRLRGSSPLTREGAAVLRGLAESDLRSAIRTIERLCHTEDANVVTPKEITELGAVRLRLENALFELRDFVKP